MTAYHVDNNGDGLRNAGTMLANKTPDAQKPDDDIPMEKAANGYEYDAYENTDVNSNNLNNKPLSMESRSEGQGGGNGVDVFNKNTYSSSTDSQSYDMGNASSSQFENNAVNEENNIANGDGMEYKQKERDLYSQDSKIPKDILKTKPSNSPIPDRWFKKGGSIKIENGNWTYINSKGDSVTYINKFPQFNGDEINMGKFRYRAADSRRVNKLLHNKPKNPEYTWHHKEDGETLQLVQKDIHKEFTHKGGISVIKNSKK